MDEVIIKAIDRKDLGTSKARSLRRSDYIPAVVYGKGFNRLIKIEEKDLKYLKQHHFSENVIINLEIEKDGKTEKVYTLLKDYQVHPVKENILHLDFVKVSMTKKVRVEVPIETEGDAKGIKEGGALEHVLWNVEVECLPMDIPDKIIVDVTGLGVNESIHVSDISVKDKVEILNDPKSVVLTIVPPAKVEEPEKEAAVSEEPEVIKEKAAKEGAEGKEAKEGAGQAKEEKSQKTEGKGK